MKGTGEPGCKSNSKPNREDFVRKRPLLWVLMQHRVPCAILPTERAQDAK